VVTTDPMVVNDDAGHLTPRGVLRFIVGTPPGACSRWSSTMTLGAWHPAAFSGSSRACSLLQRTNFAGTSIRGRYGPV